MPYTPLPDGLKSAKIPSIIRIFTVSENSILAFYRKNVQAGARKACSYPKGLAPLFNQLNL